MHRHWARFLLTLAGTWHEKRSKYSCGAFEDQHNDPGPPNELGVLTRLLSWEQ